MQYSPHFYMSRFFIFLRYLLVIFVFGFLGKQKVIPSVMKHAQPASIGISSSIGITGPDLLCLYYGSTIGDFFGGGVATDVFKWKVISPSGMVLTEREGGFQTFSFIFSEAGAYVIELRVRRKVETVFEGSREVIIQQGPSVVLQQSYLLCDNSAVEMTFLDPTLPNISNYTIKWTDSRGATVGNGNSFSAHRPDRYTVSIHTNGPQGQLLCPFETNVQVFQPNHFAISLSENQICDSGNAIIASVSNNVFGKWYFQKQGESIKTLLGEGSSIRFSSSGELNGPGDYTILFEADDREPFLCKLEDSIPLKILPSGDVAFEVVEGADACGVANGSMVVRALGDLSLLRIRLAGTTIFSRTNLFAGETLTIPNLRSGIYSVSGAIGPCSRTRSTVVELKNPGDLAFSITGVVGESCDATGIVSGKISIKMDTGPFSGTYRLFSNTGGLLQTVDVNGLTSFDIETRAGNYFFDLVNSSGCSNPHKERITIPAKGQVFYSIPARISVCQELDFIPQTAQDLVFQLTYPSGEVVIRPKGGAFKLDQAGEYKLLGSNSNPDLGTCPREEFFEVMLVPAFDFEPLLVSSDCFGNRVYKADLFGGDINSYAIKWINEQQEVVGNGEFLFPTTHGSFLLDVQPLNSEWCAFDPKQFLIPEFIDNLQVNLNASPICPGSDAVIRLEGDLRQVTHIKWLFYNGQGEVDFLSSFENEEQISVAEAGAYEVVVYNVIGCEIGRSLVQVQVSYGIADFELEAEMEVCEGYELLLPTPLDMVFLVTDPKGESRAYAKGEVISLLHDGTYTVVSSGIGDEVGLCSVTKNVLVSIKNTIEYEVQLLEENCEGELIYSAVLSELDGDEVEFFWFDPAGKLVGTGQIFSPLSNGTFSLEVRDALSCSGIPKSFVVQLPEVAIPVRLDAGPFCLGGQPATISLNTDFSKVMTINWTFQDLLGNRTLLVQFSNMKQIEVMEQGIYEVEVLNDKGCIIGDDLIFMLKSIDDLKPKVGEMYTFCAQKKQYPEINPGKFIDYSWSLGGSEVSRQPTFRPSQSGLYTLTVSNGSGCSYSVPFEVKEDCALNIRFPNAFKPGDPLREFLLYADDTVEEVEVLVYSKWGDLLFSCTSRPTIPGNPICQWDGLANGKATPAGNYALKISYKLYANPNREIALGTLTLIE
jgi:hypothetical protein